MAYSPIMPNMKLTPEDMGVPNYMNALLQGMQGSQQAAKTVNTPRQLSEDYLKSVLKNQHDKTINKYLDRSEQARIANTEANTGLTGEQAKYWGPNINSEIGLRDAQKGLYGAQTSEAQRKTDLYKQMMGGNETSSGGNNGNGGPESGIGESAPYGIPIPKPTKEDIASKMLFGLDTFGPKQKQAFEEQKIEQKKHSEKLEKTNAQVEALGHQGDLLNRYNHLMDKSILSGPFGSKVPVPTALNQKIDDTVKQMQLGGIEAIRAAMGNSRFSNLDMQMATQLKANRALTPEARKEYTNRFNAIKDRVNDYAKFSQIASNPKMGLTSDMADALWTAYQRHHPVVKKNSDVGFNKYKPNNFMSYLTPQAINSIKEQGDYNPKDKGLIHDLSPKEESIVEKHSLDELEAALARKKKESK